MRENLCSLRRGGLLEASPVPASPDVEDGFRGEVSSQGRSLGLLLVASVALPLGRDRLCFGSPIRSQALPDLYLVVRHAALLVTTNVALVTLMRLDEFSLGCHRSFTLQSHCHDDCR